MIKKIIYNIDNYGEIENICKNERKKCLYATIKRLSLLTGLSSSRHIPYIKRSSIPSFPLTHTVLGNILFIKIYVNIK